MAEMVVTRYWWHRINDRGSICPCSASTLPQRYRPTLLVAPSSRALETSNQHNQHNQHNHHIMRYQTLALALSLQPPKQHSPSLSPPKHLPQGQPVQATVRLPSHHGPSHHFRRYPSFHAAKLQMPTVSIPPKSSSRPRFSLWLPRESRRYVSM